MYKIYCQAKKSVTGLNYQFSICFGGFSLIISMFTYSFFQGFTSLKDCNRLSIVYVL